jgi:hypothetical protein
MWLYISIGVVLVALATWGVIAYRGHHASARANAKAEQLNQKFEANGLPTFADTEDIARLLGTDGGAVCDTPGKTLSQALTKFNLANGAGGPGQRPVISDTDVLKGEYLIVQTYCPQKLEDFKDFFKDLDFDSVVNN